MQLRFPQLILILFVASTADFASAAPVDFVRDVQPILVKHCIVCHGPGKQESGYRIDLFETLLRGGESETVAVVTADIEQSHLIARVTSNDPLVKMPPKGTGLENKEIEIDESINLLEDTSDESKEPGKEIKQFINSHKFVTGDVKRPPIFGKRPLGEVQLSEEAPVMKIFATGSGTFNIQFRKAALSKNLTLNEKGLYKIDSPKNKKVLGQVEVDSEKDIFDAVGIKYLEPKDRTPENIVYI